ncbi:MAG: LytTR family DNA-binding domain-containing protein [Bacteroidales bacterium]
MEPIKAIIVEDELPARETLEHYLDKYCPGVNVIDTASDANVAIEKLRNQHVDLVFLDVELPFGNAFDILDKVGAIKFETIFITAYEQYAIEALNHDAVHYILKPVDIEDLIKAVDKVRRLINTKKKQQQEENTIRQAKDYKALQGRKFVFPHVNGFDLIEIRNIVSCKADNNYTEFTLMDGSKKIISKTLKTIQQQLEEYGFLRVHKKFLINIEHVISYQKGKTGRLTMVDQTTITVTSSGKTLLLNALK